MTFLFLKFKKLFQKNPFQSNLENLIKFNIHNLKLYETAFTHKSAPMMTSMGHKVNNERLEFLGDAVLEAIVSDFLYKKFPDKSEGFLTEARSILVKRVTLNELGKKMGLQKLIKATDKKHHINLLGNVYEALVGAVYLDLGYMKCEHFIRRSFEEYLNVGKLVVHSENYKTDLIQWCQKNKCNYAFNLIRNEYKENNTIQFQTEVFINDNSFGLGVGTTKKESEQNAAHKAIHQLKTTHYKIPQYYSAEN